MEFQQSKSAYRVGEYVALWHCEIPKERSKFVRGEFFLTEAFTEMVPKFSDELFAADVLSSIDRHGDHGFFF